MIHKTSVIPGLSKFLDKHVLSQYPPTSMKRILAAGALSLYLQQNTKMVDTILNNPLFSGLGVSNDTGMIDIDKLREVYKAEVNKAGFVRVHFPLIGDVDFTPEDIDCLHREIYLVDQGVVPDTASSSFNHTA